MFRVGDKVIFIGFQNDSDNSFSPPKVDGEYTVHSFCNWYPGFIRLVENLYDVDGETHSFNHIHFRKLDTDWAEKVLAEVAESVEQDELVLI